MEPVIYEGSCPRPERATEESAGYDLVARFSGEEVRGYDSHNREFLTVNHHWMSIQPGHRALIPTGFKIKLPSGTFGQVSARSSMGLKKGLCLAQSVGVIDADYFGEIYLPMVNLSEVAVILEEGDRLAQLIIQPYLAPEWVDGEVSQTTSRAGGFGSSGR